MVRALVADSSSSNGAPYWRLISVLLSTQPLEESVALTLYQTAVDLFRKDGGMAKIAGDVLSGEVRNLKQHATLGQFGGPMFEASIDTPRGSGMVRFLVTREGLEQNEPAKKPKKPKYLN